MHVKKGFVVYVHRFVAHPLNRRDVRETGPHLIGAFPMLTDSEANVIAQHLVRGELPDAEHTTFNVRMEPASDFEVRIALCELARPDKHRSDDLVELATRCAVLLRSLDRDFASPKLIRLVGEESDRFFDPTGLPVYFAASRPDDSTPDWSWDIESALYRQAANRWVHIDYRTPVDLGGGDHAILRGILDDRKATEWLLNNRIMPPAELEPYASEFILFGERETLDAGGPLERRGTGKLLPRPKGKRPRRLNGSESDRPWMEWERAILDFICSDRYGVQACWERHSIALVSQAGVEGRPELERIHARGNYHRKEKLKRQKRKTSPAEKI